MDSIKIRQHVGQDGILHLDIPVEMADTEIEVTVTIQRVTPILCEAAYNALRLEAWGYTNKACLRRLIICIFI